MLLSKAPNTSIAIVADVCLLCCKLIHYALAPEAEVVQRQPAHSIDSDMATPLQPAELAAGACGA